MKGKNCTIILLLLTILTLNVSALDLINEDYQSSVNQLTKSNIQLLTSTTSNKIETYEGDCIVIYYYKDNICNRIDYLIEDGFYKDNLLRIRLRDCPYQTTYFICCEEDKKLLVSIYKLPYEL